MSLTIPVVTADEMARVEKLAFSKGSSQELFMEHAGKGMAKVLSACAHKQVITLLAGRGNNGGDGYAAAFHLMKEGLSVKAIAVYPLADSSPLCIQMHNRFKESGGKIHYLDGKSLLNLKTAVENDKVMQDFDLESLSTEESFTIRECSSSVERDSRSKSCITLSFPTAVSRLKLPLEGVILDGLVGTGFHGQAEGVLAEVIALVNQADLPVFSIDIPSGLDGNTGEVKTCAIQADFTLYLGSPKLGFFIQQGWDHVGELIGVDFGLSQDLIESSSEVAHLVDLTQIHALLPPISRSRHKYDAGYVLGWAGSPGMAGAAILSSHAALRSGAGIVRLFHPENMDGAFVGAPPELIYEKWSAKRMLIEQQRAKAAFFGPGLGRDKKTGSRLKAILAKLTIPCVLDADALYFLSTQKEFKLPKHSVLTPHHQEMSRLLGSPKKGFTWADCARYAEDHQVTIVLKGAPTVIFHPGSKPFIVTAGDPGMATAGSGDVLTGILAACLAQGKDPLEGSILAVALHGMAGEAAAEQLTSYCMTASDLIDYLPEAFRRVLEES